MSSWSCPHLEECNDRCRRLKTDCVPGRPGCIMPSDMTFAVSVEERIKRLEGRKRLGNGLKSPRTTRET
jgi:hypothetical protein